MARYRIVIKTAEIGSWSTDVDALDQEEAIYAAIDQYLGTPRRDLRVLRWDALSLAKIQVVDRWSTASLSAAV